MANSEAPIGQRYDLVYLPREEATRDSPRLRKRLGAVASDLFRDFSPQLGKRLEQELGVDVPWAGVAELRDLEEFFRKADLPTMLAAITICFRYASTYSNLHPKAARWLEFVRRAMPETNVGYRVDDACGVHPLVDQHFERQRVAVVAALGDARYAAVLHAIEEAHRAIEETPPNGKMGIRHTFEAAETLFKLLCDTTKVQVLGTDEIRGYLTPIVQRQYADPPALASAVARYVTSFSGWVSAAHPFRHGQKTEVPITVPFEFAVAMMASGASFIRWLAQIDCKIRGGA